MVSGSVNITLIPYVGMLAIRGASSQGLRDMIETAHMTVEGMSCNGCSGKLQRALEVVGGVTAVDIVLEGGKVTVSYDPAQVAPAVFREVVEDTGFDVVS